MTNFFVLGRACGRTTITTKLVINEFAEKIKELKNNQTITPPIGITKLFEFVVIDDYVKNQDMPTATSKNNQPYYRKYEKRKKCK